MTFSIKVRNANLQSFMRSCGYKPIEVNFEGQLNCVKPLGANYPRFHAYVRQMPDNSLQINLHLDQKQPSYEGSHAHSGEYEGEIVLMERRRIEAQARDTDDEPDKR